MMKRLLVLATLALALFACNKEGNEVPNPVSNDITGIWELSSVATKATVGNVQVSVYVEFTADGKFTLYQKIGDGRYARFDGSYTLTQDGKLTGSYNGGASWGPYDATVNGDTLTLTSAGGKEVDTYKKVSAIPPSVSGNLY